MEHKRAVLEQDHLVQHLFDVRDQVGGDEHSALLIVVGQNGAEDKIPGRRVYSGDGFIQQIQLGLPGHDQHQLDLLLRALGHGFQPVLRLHTQAPAHSKGFVIIKVLIKIPEQIKQIHRPHPAGEVHPVGQIAYLGLGCGTDMLAIDL